MGLTAPLKKHLLFSNPTGAAFCLLVIAVLIFHPRALSAQSHEWATIDRIEISGEDEEFRAIIHSLEYPVLGGKDTVKVHEFIHESDLTLLWYFASWCWNCNQEIEHLNTMYERYHDEGFHILGIGLYSSVEDLQKFQEEYHVNFPVVVGPSQAKELDSRMDTHHYALRKMAGDQRTWGTPFNIFVTHQSGLQIYAAPGELKPWKLSKFIQTHLR